MLRTNGRVTRSTPPASSRRRGPCTPSAAERLRAAVPDHGCAQILQEPKPSNGCATIEFSMKIATGKRLLHNKFRWWFCAFLTLVIFVTTVVSQAPPPERVGPLANGGFLLNSGWRLAPAGRQVPLDSFPMSSALSRDGRYLLVLNAGYNPPSISVLDTTNSRELSRVPVADAWLGLTFSPK